MIKRKFKKTKLDVWFHPFHRFFYLTRRLFEYSRYLMRIIYATRNWWEVVKFRIGLKKDAIAYLRNGLKVELTPKTYPIYSFLVEVINSDPKVRLKINKNIIEFNGIKFKIKEEVLSNTLSQILRIFFIDEYKHLNVKNKDVIDVGAFIGDTAIYFSLKGARIVHAFEPYPYTYKMAKENVEINGLKNILLYNEAIGGYNGYVIIDPKYINYTGDSLKTFSEGLEIKIRSLNSFVSQLRLNNAVLKLDCEGCEYEAILNSNNKTLETFSEIIIEYHYGYYKLMKKLRSSGFEVKILSEPKYDYNPHAENPHMLRGILYAQRTTDESEKLVSAHACS